MRLIFLALIPAIASGQSCSKDQIYAILNSASIPGTMSSMGPSQPECISCVQSSCRLQLQTAAPSPVDLGSCAIACTAQATAAGTITAIAAFWLGLQSNAPRLVGFIRFSQAGNDPASLTEVAVDVTGTMGSCGANGCNFGEYHIHEFPMDLSNPAGPCSPQAIGGHYNPLNKTACNSGNRADCELGGAFIVERSSCAPPSVALVARISRRW